MRGFDVGRADYSLEDFGDCSVRVSETTPARAAESYVESHLADLDYPEEVRIRVKECDEQWVFDVTVLSVPEAIAKEVRS